MTSTTTGEKIVYAGDLWAAFASIAKLSSKFSSEMLQLEVDTMGATFNAGKASATAAKDEKVAEGTSKMVAGGITIGGVAVSSAGSAANAKSYTEESKTRENGIKPDERQPAPQVPNPAPDPQVQQGTGVQQPVAGPQTGSGRGETSDEVGHYNKETKTLEFKTKAGAKAHFAAEHKKLAAIENFIQMAQGFQLMVQGLGDVIAAGYTYDKGIADSTQQLINNTLSILFKLYDNYIANMNAAADAAKTLGQVYIAMVQRSA